MRFRAISTISGNKDYRKYSGSNKSMQALIRKHRVLRTSYLLTLALDRRAHGHELFRRRGMDTERAVELRLGYACHHGRGKALDDFTRIRTDHVHAQYPV